MLNEFKRLKSVLKQSGEVEQIERLLGECDELYLSIKEDAIFLYEAFTMISILSIMNFSFLVEHIITYLVTRKLDRFYTMPQILHFTDTFLAICSVMILRWYS